MSLLGGATRGGLTRGAFDLDYAESIADAVDSLLEKPWLDRSWWLMAQPRDASTSTTPVTTIDVNLSTDGHRLRPDDPDYASIQQLKEALEMPYSVGINLQGLWGVASMDFGLILIGDADGSRRSLAGEDWIGRRADVYVGPRGGRQVEFARIGQLLSRNIGFDRDMLSLQVDDYGFLFDRAIQENSYLGRDSVTGSDLTFTASNDKITSGGSTDLSVLSGYNYIKVLGSSSNDATLRITSASASEIQVNASVTGLIDEAAGTPITIEGALQGGDELKGRPRPILLGVERQLEPVLVDGTDSIYHIHDGENFGSIDSVIAAYDGRSALDFDADYADITLASPAPGEYATCLATGHIRLGEPPQTVLTIEAKGHDSSSYGYVDDIAGLTKLLAVEFAGLSDPGELDGVAFSALSSHTAPMGHWTGTEPQSVRSVMEIFCRSAAAWAWLKPSKVLTVGRITDPDSATADFSVNAEDGDLRMAPWEVQPFEIPKGRVRVGYRHYSRVLSDTEVLAAVDETTRKDAGKEFRYAKDEDPDVFKQTPDADETVILTQLDQEADAQALATEQLALRKVIRRSGTFSARKGLIKRGIGHVFELTDEKLPISPKKWVIVGLDNEAGKDGSADTVVWRCFG